MKTCRLKLIGPIFSLEAIILAQEHPLPSGIIGKKSGKRGEKLGKREEESAKGEKSERKGKQMGQIGMATPLTSPNVCLT